MTTHTEDAPLPALAAVRDTERPTPLLANLADLPFTLTAEPVSVTAHQPALFNGPRENR
jgi:hypothetical protein